MDYTRNYTQNRPLNTPRYTPGSELLLPQLAHMREEENRPGPTGLHRRPVHPALAQAQAQNRQPPMQTHPALLQVQQNRPPPTQTHPALAQHNQQRDESRSPGLNQRQDVNPALAYIREQNGLNVAPRRETSALTHIPEYVTEPEMERHPTNDPRQAHFQSKDFTLPPLPSIPASTSTPAPASSLAPAPTAPRSESPKQLPAVPLQRRSSPPEIRRLPLAHIASADDDTALALAHIREAQRLLTPAHLRGEKNAKMIDLNFNPDILGNQPSVTASERYYGHRRFRSPMKKSAGRIESSSAFSPESDSDWDELMPQPSNSPDDPLNWSWKKKHLVLLALIPGCLLSDWTLTWGTTVFELQAPEWNMSLPAVAQSVSPGIFMQGPGGILAVPLCQKYGRLTVLFWSQLLSLIFTTGATVAPDYASFTAMRTLEGFFGAAPQVIGLSMIQDMFFFNERARKVNIWAASFLIGPYLGPFFSSLLLLKLGWRPDFGVLCGFYALSLLMVIFLGDETLFDRSDMDKLSPGQARPAEPRRFSVKAHITHLLVGIPARRRCPSTPTLWRVFKDQCHLLTRPNLLIPTALFVTPVTMWTIGMVSTVSMFVLPPPPYGYGFSYVALAMLYLAPIIGTLLAEGWGHWFNDLLARRYGAQHGPESRLTAVYPATLIGVVGLIVFGQTLQHGFHWVGLAFGWAMLCFCTLASMTAISSYTLDCFPDHAALGGAWINFWRVVGGFTVIYFQLEWVHKNGPAVAFGCQAVVIAGATLTVVATQIWGRRWRERWPAPQAEERDT